jgi:trehalose 6-phosphate synthase/phosphatase
MNLPAKEYLASRFDQTGVLILSEMAGAAKELGESLIVNPNSRVDVANAIHQALNMSKKEQVKRNAALQKRLKIYNEERWANDFINSLEGVKKLQESNYTRKVTVPIIKKLVDTYKRSEKRIIFLDYDGTLTGFHNDPQKAMPDDELYGIMEKLTASKNNNVVVISGRDKETLSKWFRKYYDNLAFIAEHGVWNKNPGSEWAMSSQIDKEWMEIIEPVLQNFVDRTPRSFIEYKNYSLVWHYRHADPDMGQQRAWELKDDLKNYIANLNLEIMDGDMVIEIKNAGINKGIAALNKIGKNDFDFILALGDDWTDEYTFNAMPDSAFTIKVGTKTTAAKYYINDVKSVRNLLKQLES